MTTCDNWIGDFRGVLAECRAISERKLKEYGVSWREYRPATAIDNILIKALRIRSLEEMARNGERPSVDEGVRAEYIGVINYTLIALLLCRFPDRAPILNAAGALALTDDLAEEAVALMERKTRDYSDAWKQMEMTSFTDIIIARIRRMKDLLRATGPVESEGVDAQLIDTLNYAVFAAMRLEPVQNF